MLNPFEIEHDYHRVFARLSAKILFRLKRSAYSGAPRIGKKGATKISIQMNTGHPCWLTLRHTVKRLIDRRRDATGATLVTTFHEFKPSVDHSKAVDFKKSTG